MEGRLTGQLIKRENKQAITERIKPLFIVKNSLPSHLNNHKMEDEKITKARYNFQKALRKLANKYREKGLKIYSIDIIWKDKNNANKM